MNVQAENLINDQITKLALHLWRLTRGEVLYSNPLLAIADEIGNIPNDDLEDHYEGKRLKKFMDTVQNELPRDHIIYTRKGLREQIDAHFIVALCSSKSAKHFYNTYVCKNINWLHLTHCVMYHKDVKPLKLYGKTFYCLPMGSSAVDLLEEFETV